MKERAVDWNKPVGMRNGWELEIWATGSKMFPDRPVRGAYKMPDGSKVSCSWTINGKFVHDGYAHDFDIINLPEQHTVDAYFYKTATGKIIVTQIEVDFRAARGGYERIHNVTHAFTLGTPAT